MKKIAIVIHGGAGPDSEFIRNHKNEYEEGLQKAVEAGYKILKDKGTAIDAVEAAVNELENNPIFNAGRGAALNAKGEIQMCASIMNGKNLNSGAVAIVKNIKNPVSLAKAIMVNTKYIYLGSEGAHDYAKHINIPFAVNSYFVTEHQYDEYEKAKKDAYESDGSTAKEQAGNKYHGTVGAVAVDFEGNVASATSTGGTPYCKEGRIGDSSMIGVGSYADNNTCAASSTGDGEYLIKTVMCHSISSVMKYKEKSVMEACKEVIQKENKDIDGDIGVIAIDRNGNIGIEFNSERMLRAWKLGEDEPVIKIYKD